MQQQQGQQQVAHIQNQMNDFVNMILDRSSKAKFKTLLSDVKVTEDNYEIYGNLAYLLGLGFTNHDWNQKSLTYIISRLKDFKITQPILENFFSVIFETDLALFRVGKEKMSKMIELPVESDYSLKNKVVSIIKSSLIPVNITPTISSRFIENPDEQLTYHDLIIFNNSFYEDYIVNAITSKAFITLSSSDEFRNALQTASLNFDMQKFALIYMENIINLKDFLSVDKNNSDAFAFAALLSEDEPDIIGFLTDIDPDLTEAEANNQRILEQAEEKALDEWIDSTDIVMEENEKDSPAVLSNPEVELATFFQEFEDYLKNEEIVLDYKNNLTDLKTLFEHLLLSENELVQSFYIYLKEIKKNQDHLANPEMEANPDLLASKINVENILNFKRDEVHEFFVKTIQDYQTEYTDFATKYTSEIAKEDAVLVKMVDDLVIMLYVQDAQDKSILFSQIDNNSVFTYKHLHQMLLSVERQFLPGFNIPAYNAIYTKLKEDFTEIYDMFMKEQHIENVTLQIKLAYAFKNII